MKIKNKIIRQKVWITGLLLVALFIFLPGLGNAQKSEKEQVINNVGKEIFRFDSPKEAIALYTYSDTVAVRNAVVKYLQEESKSQNKIDAQAAATQLIALYTRETNTQELIQFCSRQLSVEKDTNLIYSLTIALAGAYQAAQDYSNAVWVLNGFLEQQRTQTTPVNILATAASLSTLYVRKGQTNEALTMLDRELNQLPPDAEKERSGTINLVVKILSQYKANDKIIEFCAKKIETEKSPLVLHALAMGLSGGYQGLQDYTNSAKVLETFLEKNRATSLPANVLTASKTLSSLYVDKFTRPDLALGMLDRELKSLPADADPEKAGMLIAKGDIYFSTLKDMASAEANYLKATEFYRTIPANAVISDAYLKLAQVYAKKGNPDQYVAALITCLSNCPALPSTPVVQKMIEVDSNINPCLDSVVWLLRDRIATQYASSIAVDQFHPDIVKLLLKQEKNQEALQEARVFLYACSDKSLPAAIDMVTMIFKTTDGNLGRANNFLRYQKHSIVGEDDKHIMPDDLKNPLLDVPPLNNERRNALFTAKLDILPNNWIGWKNRASLYIYLDQPNEAFQALCKSFEMCSVNETELQSAADALAGFTIRNTKNVKLAESLVEYIMFGQDGIDGQSGTTDDLRNPIPDIARQIQCAQRPSAQAAAKPQAQPSTNAPPDNAKSK